MNTKSTRHWTVGTVKKSQATMSLTWSAKRACHVGDGGFQTRGRYFSTVDFDTVMPSVRSSPTMRGEPHVGFVRHISWSKSRTSLAIGKRPVLPLWLKRRQPSRNRFFGQASTVRGWTNAKVCYPPDQSRENHAQKHRSAGFSGGRLTRF
jgi:hypothetical protein